MKRSQRAAHPWIWIGVALAASAVLVWGVLTRPVSVPVGPTPSAGGRP